MPLRETRVAFTWPDGSPLRSQRGGGLGLKHIYLFESLWLQKVYGISALRKFLWKRIIEQKYITPDSLSD
jgi:hypothetical protein